MTVSLLGTRDWLDGLGRRDHLDIPPLSDDTIDAYCDRRDSPWGPIRHVRHPDPVEGIPARWDRGPTRPGIDEPAWPPRP